MTARDPALAETAPAGPGGAGTLPESALLPGMVLARRYRIICSLGRGGMGQVFRAHDGVVGHDVALKFLPARVAGDPELRQRLFREVRIGREVSHPMVCRVYDVEEDDGRVFVTMEYVEGEDLGRVLARLGRLPSPRALEIAGEVAAALCAAHERGFVHCDVKPANVMIDPKGRARLTDFGVAAVVGLDEEGGTAGTPAYMAPEQLTGTAPTPQVDVYALGLLIFEMVTGRPCYDAASLPALLELRKTGPDLTPLQGELPPAVLRLVRRCLATDPAERPASAREVVALLPSPDPLAAALAAGETPAREVVAAAHMPNLPRRQAAWALAAVLAGTVALAALAPSTDLLARAGVILPPEQLERRAQAVLLLGGREVETPHDAALFAWSFPRARALGTGDSARAMPGPLDFVYRDSPRPLVAFAASGRVSAADPPLDIPGMGLVTLDGSGLLLQLRVQPGSAPHHGEPVDWPPVLALTGLDPASLQPTVPVLVAPVECDERQAWTGAYGGRTERVRVEVGARAGRPVWLQVGAPGEPAATRSGPVFRGAATSALVLFVLTLGGALVLARRNVRRGVGDLPGALRVGAVVFVCLAAGRVLRAHYAASFEGSWLVLTAITSRALFDAALAFVLYLAAEPHVRRRWPYALVSWTRLIDGRWRDPLVGRDLLLGVAAALLLMVAQRAATVLPLGPILPWGSTATILEHPRQLGAVLVAAGLSVFDLSAAFCLLTLGRFLGRRDGVAWGVLGGMPILFFLSSDPSGGARAAVSAVLASGVLVGVAWRLGYLAGTATFFAFNALSAVSSVLHGWYGPRHAVGLLVPVAIAAWGFQSVWRADESAPTA